MTIRVRQKLGKYRIDKRLGEGGFAIVYQATDTIEGGQVALKVPRPDYVTDELLSSFKNEVRLAAKLDHPHILPLKNAELIDGYLVAAFPLGSSTLGERLSKRLALNTALGFTEQLLEAVAYAHEQGIIHCDIKPDNLILFPDNHLMLTDFGIAKVAMKTVMASGSGTLGYLAPEQAMGKPSFRSDVFSIGLVLYRMFTGQLPEWPYDWPPPGYERLRQKIHADMIHLLRRSIEPNPRKRYRDAGHMLTEYLRIKKRVLVFATGQTMPNRRGKDATTQTHDWREVRQRQFIRAHSKSLETRHKCAKCEGPVSEAMRFCPWCDAERTRHSGDTKFPQHCPRCHRGMKLDWKFCPWCYGKGFEVQATREYPDKKYTARCSNARCSRKQLMPFMRYCPWCRTKVKKNWPIPETKERCPSCKWGVVSEFWSYCPWCGVGVSSD